MIRPVRVDRGRFRKFGRVYNEGTHRGHDFDCPENSHVYAVCAGVVEFSGELNGFGSLNPSSPGGVVIVRHNDNGRVFWGLYGHVKHTVKKGDAVKEGDLIGYVAGFTNAGVSLPHLHYGENEGTEMPLTSLGYGRDVGDWVNPLK